MSRKSTNSGRSGRASQLRLTGGLWRGRRLRIGPGVRPTEGRVREALFSIWQGRIVGARILDLFAGSGAIGLEAVGRGASGAALVEGSPKVLSVLRANVETLLGDEVDSTKLLLQKGILPGWLTSRKASPSVLALKPYDLIFADPPYRFDEFPALLLALVDWLAEDGQLAVEHSSRAELPDSAAELMKIDQRTYGESCLSLFAKG